MSEPLAIDSDVMLTAGAAIERLMRSTQLLACEDLHVIDVPHTVHALYDVMERLTSVWQRFGDAHVAGLDDLVGHTRLPALRALLADLADR